MPEKLCIQVRAPAPSRNFPGEVEYGYYVVEGGTVTLTDSKGTPLSDGGRQYSHQLRDGENARIRAVLLSRLRRRNDSPRGFGRPIAYPKDWNRVV
jgi:hypothetical protein